MNPRLRWVLLAFLAGFVLLSLIPALPGLWQSLAAVDLSAVATVATEQSDLLLGTAAALLAVVLGLNVRRRIRRQQASAFSDALSRSTASKQARGAAMVNSPRRAVKPAARAPRRPAPPASELEVKIRAGATKGERIPALARRHGISIDAVRAALGDSLPEAAARPGSSFRARQQRLPAKPPAALQPVRRNPYGALA
ncbi:MAG TPA: hypothetical protein VLD58_12980 [Gemmatimonadales bacterium]|nr:hypothetical protein [Gemmatimonadales bacterium]